MARRTGPFGTHDLFENHGRDRFAEVLFTVEGAGPLPLDMLRYDSCFPATEEDAATAVQYPGECKGRRRIKLIRRTAGLPEPTEARWRSFGWRVVPISELAAEEREAAAARRAERR